MKITRIEILHRLLMTVVVCFGVFAIYSGLMFALKEDPKTEYAKCRSNKGIPVHDVDGSVVCLNLSATKEVLAK